jgi:hypothetical protein
MEGFSITELDPPDSRKSNYRRGINATNKRIQNICIQRDVYSKINNSSYYREMESMSTKTRVAPIQRLNTIVRMVNDCINSWKCHSS